MQDCNKPHLSQYIKKAMFHTDRLNSIFVISFLRDDGTCEIGGMWHTIHENQIKGMILARWQSGPLPIKDAEVHQCIYDPTNSNNHITIKKYEFFDKKDFPKNVL